MLVSLLGVGTALRLERVALSNYITTKGKQLEGAFFLGRALKLRRFDKEGGGRQRGLSSRCSSRRFFCFGKTGGALFDVMWRVGRAVRGWGEEGGGCAAITDLFSVIP